MSNKNGLSSYYSHNITSDEAEFLTKFMESKNLSPLNSRVIKLEDGSLEILIASASILK